jgi:hypothetical protein
MADILLLGAGFSRNWGGWLAPEMFEYLLGCSELAPPLRDLLWDHRHTGGYEGALAQLLGDDFRHGNGSRRTQFEMALALMFADMDKKFEAIEFEFQASPAYMVRAFLNRFDAIFTLNQDLLLERHYLNANFTLGNGARWSGWQLPGMVREAGDAGTGRPSDCENCGIWVPGSQPTVQPGQQPYFKLHGSSNWRDSDGRSMIAAVGDDPTLLNRFPVIPGYHEALRKYLSPPVRVMVIGYGFGDQHINDMLRATINIGELKLFIIDPLGWEVMDQDRHLPSYPPGRLVSILGPAVAGASRRPLREIFGNDHVEHARVMSFLQ